MPHKIQFDCNWRRIVCDTSAPPFDGNPVLIKLAAGWVEAYWEPSGPEDPNGECDGFLWVCLDDKFQAKWDEPSLWAEIPK